MTDAIAMLKVRRLLNGMWETRRDALSVSELNGSVKLIYLYRSYFYWSPPSYYSDLPWDNHSISDDIGLVEAYSNLMVEFLKIDDGHGLILLPFLSRNSSIPISGKCTSRCIHEIWMPATVNSFTVIWVAYSLVDGNNLKSSRYHMR